MPQNEVLGLLCELKETRLARCERSFELCSGAVIGGLRVKVLPDAEDALRVFLLVASEICCPFLRLEVLLSPSARIESNYRLPLLMRRCVRGLGNGWSFLLVAEGDLLVEVQRLSRDQGALLLLLDHGSAKVVSKKLVEKSSVLRVWSIVLHDGALFLWLRFLLGARLAHEVADERE